MKQEDRELLLKDLCARLSYGVMVNAQYKDSEGWKTGDRKILGLYEDGQVYLGCIYTTIDCIKPYLRPLSSLTSEDKAELNAITEEFGDNWFEATTPEERWKCCFLNSSNEIDWLISHHIDYRGLIPMGLALEALEEMYEY